MPSIFFVVEAIDTASDSLTEPIRNPPSINDSGTVAFDAFLDPDTTGIYTVSSNGDIATVVDESGDFDGPHNSSINNDGTVVFTARDSRREETRNIDLATPNWGFSIETRCSCGAASCQSLPLLACEASGKSGPCIRSWWSYQKFPAIHTGQSVRHHVAESRKRPDGRLHGAVQPVRSAPATDGEPGCRAGYQPRGRQGSDLPDLGNRGRAFGTRMDARQ